METNYLNEFIAFSKTLNFAQAADALFLSQPTLRAHIKALEAEIGAPFVMKKGGKFELTPAGRMFLKKSYEITENVESALKECRAYSRNTISLVVGDLGCIPFLEATIEAKRAYNAQSSDDVVEIRIATKMCSNIESLCNGDVDVALFARVRDACDEFTEINLPTNVEAFPLKTVQMLFWVTKDSPLYDKQTVYAEDLQGHTLLVGASQNMMAAGQTVRNSLEKAGVVLGVDSCPFDSYSEYYVSGSGDTFGITHEASPPIRTGVRLFTVENLTFLSDLYTLVRINNQQQGLHPFFSQLKKNLGEAFA